MAAGKTAALRALKTMAAWHDRLRPAGRGVVVLIYHRVGGGSGTEIDLPPELFDEQMAGLAAERRVIALDDALDRLASPSPDGNAPDRLVSRIGDGFDQPTSRTPEVPARPASPSSHGRDRRGLPSSVDTADQATQSDKDAADWTPGAAGEPDPVVVTFDDGTADLAEVALPILARHHIPATVYLATDFVDAGRSFPADGTPLSWAAVGDMVASGWVTVGSHTHTHALLDRLSPGEAADEVDRSIELIGEHVGAAPRHFAYPKAVAPPAPVEELVRSRFRSAALAGNRPNPYGRSDPHRLARSAIQVSDGMTWFRRKAEGGMAFEDTLRRTLNRARYARATS